jgi:hypothetical protein
VAPDLEIATSAIISLMLGCSLSSDCADSQVRIVYILLSWRELGDLQPMSRTLVVDRHLTISAYNFEG